jgi:hypothetical protein
MVRARDSVRFLSAAEGRVSKGRTEFKREVVPEAGMEQAALRYSRRFAPATQEPPSSG